MANYKKSPAKEKLPPAKTPEARENQILARAWDLIEERILDGTASNALLVQCLRMGSSKERFEKDLINTRIENLQAKTQAIEAEKRVDELYAKALDAMRIYSGQRPFDDDEEVNDA